jgi:hypothetical protein
VTSPRAEELAAARALLARAGHPDAAVATVGSQTFVTLREGRAAFHALCFHRIGREWWVHVGAAHGGGFRASTQGRAGEPLGRVLARAVRSVDEPFRAPEPLAAFVARRFPEVVRALASPRAAKTLGVFAETDAAGARFTWSPIVSDPQPRRLRQAYVAALAAARAAGLGDGVEVGRGKLRARSWDLGRGTLAIWETDHDPADGRKLVAARWRAKPSCRLPPW